VNTVIKSNYNTALHHLLTLLKVSPVHIPVLFRSFWQQVSKYFSSDDAIQILSLVAFFLVRTPFDTSGVYTLLSYTEFRHDGYFNVEGGMYKIVEGIVRELGKEHVTITFNTESRDCQVNGNELKYLIDQNGNKWTAYIIVINADAAVFRGTVFKRREFSQENLDRKSWTMVPLTIYLGLKGKPPGVHHQNYYPGDNFREYADKVFKSPGDCRNPTIT